MSKVIYIDVGTHFGQEYKSLFGSDYNFILRSIKRLIGYHILKKGNKFTFKDFQSIKLLRKKAKEIRKDFLFYFVEANSKIINHDKVYNSAHGVFNCALTNKSLVDITKLYIARKNPLSLGSSIFETKFKFRGWDLNDFVKTVGIPANVFFQALKQSIESLNEDYVVILRINCEGVEDDVIYAAHSYFKDKLVLILGSLKDVKICKSEEAYNKMMNYLNFNKLPFEYFSPSTKNWVNAHTSIIKAHKNLFND
tara:strand:- start:3862 stop:4617 length:756 start_codon:yes stop_codon:yes gene_type:complete